MKQINNIIFLLTGLLFILPACKENQFWVKGEGSNVTNSRSIGQFEGVSLSLDAEVVILKDSICRIELNGQQNILNVIETKRSGNVLQIRLKSKTSIRKHNPIKITVYMPSVNHLDLNGSGEINNNNTFTTENLNCHISGSGQVYFTGTIKNRLDVQISGSGKAYIHSSDVCQWAKFSISGSGSIDAEWAKANNTEAEISGSGQIRCYAIQTLKAGISGSGKIYYRGKPQTNISVSGSGKVIGLD